MSASPTSKIQKTPELIVASNPPNCLQDCNYKNTPEFNFNGRTFEAKCIKVYDGDTITVAINVFGSFHRFSVRMLGYDTPEMKPKDYADYESKQIEKKCATISRDFLSDLLLGKMVKLHCKQYDKYGRILGNVELGDVDVNALMIEKGYGKIYDGGHKQEWDFKEFMANLKLL